jgi:hypothetical protein
VDNGDGTPSETWRAVVPVTTTTRQLIRLAVTIAPPP